jgi:hypothetical protein
MKRLNLDTATVSQLVERFIEISVSQDEALLRQEISKFNRLFDQLEEVEHALKKRAGDQRQALIPLYEHPNMQVRVTAAKATLAVAPSAARQTLESIRESKWPPQALDAGMCLRALDRGIFKPT